MTQLAQQREVLHVARADLQNVGVALHQLELADVHDLRHQLQIVAVGRAAQHAQAFFAEPLEAVRRAARLERAAAQHLGAGALDRGRRGFDLLFGLGRTGAGHHDDFVAADPHVADRDDAVFRLERAAGQLVRLGDPQDFLHAVQHLEQPWVAGPVAAHRADDGAKRARRAVHVEAHFHELRNDALDLFVGGALLHDYDHDYLFELLMSSESSYVACCPCPRGARAAALRR